MAQLYNRDKRYQECHFKQHWFPWSTFQDASFSPQESPKFPDSKNYKIWQIWHKIFQIWSYSVLIEIKVVGNYILNNLYLHDKLPILHSSFSGSLQSWPNSLIWIFLDLTQIFHIWPDSVLNGMNDVNHVIYNNLNYDKQLLNMHCFLTRSL